MNVTFQCPSCMRPLQYESGETVFQICTYCKGNIIVPSDAVHKAEAIQKEPTDFLLIRQKNLKLDEIRRELQGGRNIQAITMFSDTFGTGLREAQQAIDLLAQGKQVDVSRSALRQNYSIAQEIVNQAKYPYAAIENPTARSISVVVMSILIALGAALFFFLSSK